MNKVIAVVVSLLAFALLYAALAFVTHDSGAAVPVHAIASTDRAPVAAAAPSIRRAASRGASDGAAR